MAALKAEWKPRGGGGVLRKDVYAYFKKNSREGGACTPGLTAYTVAYIAHVPLEPRAALAEWKDGKLTVWTGIAASLRRAQRTGAAIQHWPKSRVRVIVPDTGSGYGGKHNGDAAAGSGAPGESRRQAGEAQLDPRRGNDVGLFPSRRPDRSGRQAESRWHARRVGNAQLQLRPLGAANSLRRARERRSSFTRRKSPLRQGSYRGLAATANHFVRESYMDELAHSAEAWTRWNSA